VVDANDDKAISFSEFVAATLDPKDIDLGELSAAFNLIDEDGNGYITANELYKVSCLHQNRISAFETPL
jgi:Ca2+-binding EF-hand superfamily protein